MSEGLAESRERAAEILATLEETYPKVQCGLVHDSAFQLLTATILSAQCTDRGVNQVTPKLFAAYPTAEDLAQADHGDVEKIIHSTGFYQVKADRIISMSRMLLIEYAGQVPSTLDELLTLSGVGRKTANVVLGEWFGVPGITVDTHVLRLSRRLGLSNKTDPAKVEADLCELFDETSWISLSRSLIGHGRTRCHARKPACGACPLGQLCPSFGEGEIDPVLASELVKIPQK
ncbi:MAG: endonuclease III [Propionibacteriaceae bacterium]|nr:endonuclease III [Propionibacteriaceae bacterium]